MHLSVSQFLSLDMGIDYNLEGFAGHVTSALHVLLLKKDGILVKCTL